MNRYPRQALLAALLCVALLPFSACERKQAPALPGNQAPEFTLNDLDGKPVRLSDFAGKVVVIDFWATWCGPCKDAAREFEELHRKYGSRGAVVLGISVNKESDAVAVVREFAAKNGMTYRLLLDDGSVNKAYSVVRIPATFVLDRKHIIRNTYPGFQPGIGGRIASDIEAHL